MEEQSQVKKPAANIIDGAIVVVLFLFAASAPNSIAATQIAWLLGMVLWLARFALQPHPRTYRTPVDYALLGFFILTSLSVLFSYEPLVSLGKLRGASLFTIVYLFAENVPSLRVVRLLALTLICACMLNVLFTIGERLLGRAVKVHQLSEKSSLYKSGIRDGDTLLEVDGQKLRDPQELLNALSSPETKPANIHVYRHEWQPTFKVPRGTAMPGSSALEQLGIGSWSRGRDWRAAGFYGHYVTYAEVLQLIIALTLGMFVSLTTKRSRIGVALFIGLAALGFALLLTVTRASWLGCMVSSAVILMLGIGRRKMIIVAMLAIPLILGGLFLLQQKRNVGFLDQKDNSTTWRQTVWTEGTALLISQPRHLLVGIGMDSMKAHWKEWGMFDQGRLPRGHMHSNFLQIALERGLPALILWLVFLFIYARTLWRSLRSTRKLHWMEHGILLGGLGGLAGFFTSGVVHYNWGDSEVVMVFYFIMGLSLAIHREIVQVVRG
ncbi:MAG: O-antigen ligase family protein [Pyrinomonadaceae bacterium]